MPGDDAPPTNLLALSVRRSGTCGKARPATAPRPDQNPGEPAGWHILASYFSQTLVGGARRAVFQRSITRVFAAASISFKVTRIKLMETFHRMSYRFFDIVLPLFK